MKTLFTIGFTKKTAEEFFTRLQYNRVSRVIDVRLFNRTQLSGFSKFPDIRYFLKTIADIDYIHDKELAPSPELLEMYKAHRINWDRYVEVFSDLMIERRTIEHLKMHYPNFDRCCLLCSEPSAEFCHRRLVAELFKDTFEYCEIIHL